MILIIYISIIFQLKNYSSSSALNTLSHFFIFQFINITCRQFTCRKKVGFYRCIWQFHSNLPHINNYFYWFFSHFIRTHFYTNWKYLLKIKTEKRKHSTRKKKYQLKTELRIWSLMFPQNSTIIVKGKATCKRIKRKNPVGIDSQ